MPLYLQLSPNLRKRSREAQMAIITNELYLLKDIEIKKLEKLLSQVKVYFSISSSNNGTYARQSPLFRYLQVLND
jgi:hypothetical protein